MLEDTTKGILDAVKENVLRSRFMTTLLMILCVLSTISFWNGKTDSWTRLRIIRQANLAQLDSLVKQETKLDGLAGYMAERAGRENVALLKGLSADTIRAVVLRQYKAGSITPDQFITISQPKVDSTFVDHLYASGRYALTQQQARDYKGALIGVQDWRWELSTAREQASQLRRKFIEANMVVDIPFFGLSFDINDLGLLAGLSLSLILLGIGYTMLREHNGMDTLIDLFETMPDTTDQEKMHRTRIYQIAAMQNVLTVPPSLFASRSCDAGTTMLRKFERFVFMLASKLVYLFPVWIYSAIRDNDIQTAAFGLTLSPDRLAQQDALGTFFLISVWVLAIGAFIAAIRIEVRWETLAGKVKGC